MTREPARFDLATPADDAALRALLRAMPVPGTVTLAATREPAFFAAASWPSASPRAELSRNLA